MAPTILTVQLTAFQASSNGFCPADAPVGGGSGVVVKNGILTITSSCEIRIFVTNATVADLRVVGAAVIRTGDYDVKENFGDFSWVDTFLNFKAKHKHKSSNATKATWKLYIAVANYDDPKNPVLGIIDPEIENIEEADKKGARKRQGAAGKDE